MMVYGAERRTTGGELGRSLLKAALQMDTKIDDSGIANPPSRAIHSSGLVMQMIPPAAQLNKVNSSVRVCRMPGLVTQMAPPAAPLDKANSSARVFHALGLATQKAPSTARLSKVSSSARASHTPGLLTLMAPLVHETKSPACACYKPQAAPQMASRMASLNSIKSSASVLYAPGFGAQSASSMAALNHINQASCALHAPGIVRQMVQPAAPSIVARGIAQWPESRYVTPPATLLFRDSLGWNNPGTAQPTYTTDESVLSPSQQLRDARIGLRTTAPRKKTVGMDANINTASPRSVPSPMLWSTVWPENAVPKPKTAQVLTKAGYSNLSIIGKKPNLLTKGSKPKSSPEANKAKLLTKASKSNLLTKDSTPASLSPTLNTVGIPTSNAPSRSMSSRCSLGLRGLKSSDINSKDEHNTVLYTKTPESACANVFFTDESHNVRCYTLNSCLIRQLLAHSCLSRQRAVIWRVSDVTETEIYSPSFPVADVNANLGISCEPSGVCRVTLECEKKAKLKFEVFVNGRRSGVKIGTAKKFSMSIKLPRGERPKRVAFQALK